MAQLPQDATDISASAEADELTRITTHNLQAIAKLLDDYEKAVQSITDRQNTVLHETLDQVNKICQATVERTSNAMCHVLLKNMTDIRDIAVVVDGTLSSLETVFSLVDRSLSIHEKHVQELHRQSEDLKALNLRLARVEGGHAGSRVRASSVFARGVRWIVGGGRRRMSGSESLASQG